MIAVIAGKGTLPLQACEQLAAQKKDFFVLALFQEVYDQFNHHALATAHLRDELNNTPIKNNTNSFSHHKTNALTIIFQPHYKLGALKKILLAHGTKEALFIGKVDKRELFSTLSLDWEAIKFLASLINKSDAAIMEHCIKELAKLSITVLPQDQVLQKLYAPPGILAGTLTPAIEQDIALGMETAEQLSLLGIGQTVVIKNGIVLAVEALEGTDACITRGIALGNEQVVICKTAHKTHNRQYDIPTLGSSSLATITKGSVAAIAWQADRLFIADYQYFIKRAHDLGIALIAR